MPIRHILLDNHELAKISKEQRAGEWAVWQTGLVNPDFADFARSCGAFGIRVDHRAELDDALAEERFRRIGRLGLEPTPQGLRTPSDDAGVTRRPVTTDADVPTLWPEHFDVGTELLAKDRRASYGVSPGDDIIATPYAYVVPWEPSRIAGSGDRRWNDRALSGASITAGELAVRRNPAATLLAWFRELRDLLLAGSD
jgi:hypothetical protein